VTVHKDNHDVVIVGAGLAGLSLARQLLRETDRRVLLLERRRQVPPSRQKVGEATVQLSGYYFSKVLGLEAHLLTEHYMKYNLRFLWPTGRSDDDDADRAIEDYSQAYIRNLSNIASFQIDRNKFEAELLRLNLEDERFTLVAGIRDLEIELADRGDHTVLYSAAGARHHIESRWVVDTSGRSKYLARRLDLAKPNEIRHGSIFWWVDGLLDIEELTDLDSRQRRLHPNRRQTGHLPFFLATNHFMTEGAWFWVIPLHGKTSLGLVFDRDLVDPDEVMSVEKATRWVCDRFPLLERELPKREVLSFGGFKDHSYDCRQTISPQRWALAGEAGRFTDPLYSPGGDLIAIYNTLIVDAVETDDDQELLAKCNRFEQLMRAAYSAYEPSYAVSYDALGDPEVFSLKYSWELAVYFAFYVFPFINDLLTDRQFQPAFLRHFAKLGPVNRGLHKLLSGYFQWKKSSMKERQAAGSGAPVLFDFTRMCGLRRAEKTFYEVAVEAGEAKRVLGEQYRSLTEMARYIVAWVAAAVLDEPGALSNRRFVEALDLERLEFEPEVWRQRWSEAASTPELYPWQLDLDAMRPFQPTSEATEPKQALSA
jgi:flavin-dependent dehydrogenase